MIESCALGKSENRRPFMTSTWSTLITIIIILATLIVISCDLVESAIVVKGIAFKVTKGFKLTQGTQLKTINSTKMSSSFCSILCGSNCGSATFSVKYKTCTIFRDRFYSSAVAWIKDSNWSVLYRDEPVQHDNWTMVFRAQKDINIPLYNVWQANGSHDDSPLLSSSLNGCYRLDNLGGCKKHFRSAILDNWTNIKQVKLALYINGSEVAYIVFDGTGSTRESWFQRSDILSSSWNTIKFNGLIADFQVPGFVANNNIRRFVICGAYGSCIGDKFYFMALDKDQDDCENEWSISIVNYPLFLYSKLDGLALASLTPKVYSFADVMAIFVKF